jgi:type IV pilus assembly protein PilE
MRGFTILELLIAVAIVGILAAMAVPQYTGYVSNSRLQNAITNLRSIYIKEQEYFTNNNSYYSTGAVCGNSAPLINTNLFSGQNIINDNFYSYCITQSAVTNFTAQATNLNSGAVYTLNHNNVSVGF